MTGFVDDPDFVAGKRLAASRNLQGMRIIRSCGFGDAVDAELIAVNAIDDGRAAEGRKGEPDGAFGKPIDWRHRLCGKAVAAKPLGKAAQRRWRQSMGLPNAPSGSPFRPSAARP